MFVVVVVQVVVKMIKVPVVVVESDAVACDEKQIETMEPCVVVALAVVVCLLLPWTTIVDDEDRIVVVKKWVRSVVDDVVVMIGEQEKIDCVDIEGDDRLKLVVVADGADN